MKDLVDWDTVHAVASATVHISRQRGLPLEYCGHHAAVGILGRGCLRAASLSLTQLEPFFASSWLNVRLLFTSFRA